MPKVKTKKKKSNKKDDPIIDLHLDKKTKKKIKKGVIILVILALILTVTLFIFGIKIKFLISDDLDIQLTPRYQSINLYNSQSVKLNYSIYNNNFANCKSVCNLNFISLKNKSVIYEETLNLKHRQKIFKNYTVNTSKFGSGQDLYSVNIECVNIKSLICPTSSNPKHKSAIISLNYNLQPKQSKIKNDSLPQLRTLIELHNKTKSSLKKSNLLVLRLPVNVIERQEISKAILLYQIKLYDIEKKLDIIVSLWNNEAYDEISIQDFESLATDLSSIRTDELITTANKTLTEWNNNILGVSSIEDKKNDIQQLYQIVKTDIKNTNLSNKFDTSIQELINLNSVYISQNSISITNQSKKIFDAINNLDEINNDIINIKTQGNELLLNSTKELTLLNISITQNKNESICSNLQSNLNALNTSIKKSVNYDLYNNFIINNCNGITPDKILMNKFISTNFKVQKNLVDTDFPEIIAHNDFELNDNLPKCCIFSDCSRCLETYDIHKTPVLFIHGHTFNENNNPEHTMNVFSKVQAKLQDEQIINYGELDSYANIYDKSIDWSRQNKSISVRASYYYIASYSLGQYEITAQKSERIENYAIRLKEIIQVIKQRTKSDKVIIVAHSMGGLVARQYGYLFGHEDIDKIIIVNTPNSGITKDASDFCQVLGANNECNDMKQDSIFLKKLSSFDIPKETYFVIRSTGCDMKTDTGDGVVTNSSGYLTDATNYEIQGRCTDSLKTNLHGNTLDPELYPEAYEIIKNLVLEE